MTVFEKIKLMDIEEFAEWLDSYGTYDDSPWVKYFNANYCEKCESVVDYSPDYNGENTWYLGMECAWCEVHDKCRFFEDMDDVPDSKEMIKMWLESEDKKLY